MEKNFVDGYLSCKAEEFLQILEQNDFDLHDTSTTSNRIKMNISTRYHTSPLLF